MITYEYHDKYRINKHSQLNEYFKMPSDFKLLMFEYLLSKFNNKSERLIIFLSLFSRENMYVTLIDTSLPT